MESVEQAVQGETSATPMAYDHKRARRTERENSTHYVYECWAGDRCLYVGLTCNPGARLTTWQRGKWWWEVDRIEIDAVPNREAGLAEELDRIATLDPIWNAIHTEDGYGPKRRRRANS